MARVEGGCCLLSPDVMRLGPLRYDQRRGLPAPSPPLKIFPAAPFCYGLGKLHTPHGLRLPLGFWSAAHQPTWLICITLMPPYAQRIP